jgi:hypothetical protein
MGLFDKAKDALSDIDTEELKDKAQDIATKADDEAEKLVTKDGVVGDIAGKAHGLLDKVDKD